MPKKPNTFRSIALSMYSNTSAINEKNIVFK